MYREKNCSGRTTEKGSCSLKLLLRTIITLELLYFALIAKSPMGETSRTTNPDCFSDFNSWIF